MSGWTPILIGREAPARKPVMTIDELPAQSAARSSRPMIYLDSSVALAYLLAEDDFPRNCFGINRRCPAGFLNARYGTGSMPANCKIRMVTLSAI